MKKQARKRCGEKPPPRCGLSLRSIVFSNAKLRTDGNVDAGAGVATNSRDERHAGTMKCGRVSKV